MSRPWDRSSNNCRVRCFVVVVTPAVISRTMLGSLICWPLIVYRWATGGSIGRWLIEGQRKTLAERRGRRGLGWIWQENWTVGSGKSSLARSSVARLGWDARRAGPIQARRMRRLRRSNIEPETQLALSIISSSAVFDRRRQNSLVSIKATRNPRDERIGTK